MSSIDKLKKELYIKVAEDVDMSVKDIESIINDYEKSIADAISKKKCKRIIMYRFGTFYLKKKYEIQYSWCTCRFIN